MNKIRQQNPVDSMRKKQLDRVISTLGWDEEELKKTGRINQKESNEVARQSAANSLKSLPNPDQLLETLVPGSREFTRSRDLVSFKPDPFAPTEIQTDGPFIDVSVPSVS